MVWFDLVLCVGMYCHAKVQDPRWKMTDLWPFPQIGACESVSEWVSQSVSESVSDEPRYRAVFTAKNNFGWKSGHH